MKLCTMLITIAFLFTLPSGSWGGDSNIPLFESIDADRNGAISMDEFINAPLGISKTKDSKNPLRLKLPSGGERQGESFTPLTAAEKRQLFNSLDKDKNNAVDSKEWASFKDGKLSFTFE